MNTNFSENWNFSPELLSTKDLQIVKCEPFSGLIYEENFPVNTFYEGAKHIACQPLQFDVNYCFFLISKSTIFNKDYCSIRIL
jgi:hypothetical protein